MPTYYQDKLQTRYLQLHSSRPSPLYTKVMESPDARRVAKLVTYIEENLRASHTAGLRFVDPRHLTQRLVSLQNHVIYGRRGAGKSTLLSSLVETESKIPIFLNLEDYKDITFPNIILHILRATLNEVIAAIRARSKWWHCGLYRIGFRRKIRAQIAEIETSLNRPDQEQQEVRTRLESTQNISSTLPGGSGGWTLGGQRNSEKEVKREVRRDKLNELRLGVTYYKKLLDEASQICRGASLFLVFDDLYFVRKEVQPELIDYFHRLTKGTNLFLKVATIRHRSQLYRQTGSTWVGTETGHDIYEIDMDYTLDKFDDLQAFMRQLLDTANRESGAHLDVDSIFAGAGFQHLCLASGGVPRDFLSLFVRLANNVVVTRNETIGKVAVGEEAISHVRSKQEALKRDSGSENEILEACLAAIREYVYREKRTNAFLVAKQELESVPQGRQALRELVDLRLIHQVDKNTSSAPSDGRRYEAYIIDVGLYDNSRPRNFSPIEPGVRDSKSRKDKLRAAPKLSLDNLAELVRKSGAGKIRVTEERHTQRGQP